MVKRIITGVAIAIGAVLIFLLANTPVYPLAWSLFGAIGCFELFRVWKLTDRLIYLLPALAGTVAVPIIVYYAPDLGAGLHRMIAAVIISVLWMSFTTVLFHAKCRSEDLVRACFAAVYMILSFGSVSLLYRAENNLLMVIPAFLAAWGTDVCAYFSGVFLGKHRLCPELSPKKTVEGSIGGVIGCVLALAIYGFVADRFFGFAPRYLFLCAGAAVASVCSQFGDLFMSKIKREQGVKDYGNLFPGHGGVLDRFDSIAVTSQLYLLLAIVSEKYPMFIGGAV